MRRAVPLILLLAVSWSPPVRAAAPLTDKARLLLDYQSFMRGDRDGGVRFLLAASKDLQNTPLAELAVRVALMYEPADLAAVTTGEVEARRLLSAESEVGPEFRDVLRRFAARSFASAGRSEEAKELHRRRGLVMSWLLAGPFNGRRFASFASPELPEAGESESRDAVANPPDAVRLRDWRRNPPWRRLPEECAFPYVRPWRWSGRGVDGAMLLFTALKMEDADHKAAFHIYSETSWRLFVDGTLAAEMDKDSQETPREHVLPYSLDPGSHEIVLQLFPSRTGSGAEEARVALRLESTARFAWSAETKRPGELRRGSGKREARRLKYLDDLRVAITENPVVMAAYALACLDQGMRDEGAWWAEEAARANPGDASLQYLAGTLAFLNPLLPPERRRDTALAFHQAALAIKQDIVPSLLFQAENASTAGKAREAAGFLEQAYAINPLSLEVLLARGGWASRFASGATARAAWDECGKTFPNSSSVQLATASMPREGFLDMDRRLAACRAAAAAGPANSEAILKLAEALADSGNGQEAASVLRNAGAPFACDIRISERIAEVYARLGLHREAMDALAEAARLVPDNPKVWRRLGDLAMESGDAAVATRHWRTSLAADPGQFRLADMLDYLAGTADRFYNEGGYDAIALTAGAEPERYPGDVIRLLDRSVIIFAEDGSYRRLTHEIDLAKNRRGGESLAGIEGRGELLTARIVFPNGNTLEPEPYPGQGGLRLPVIMPGAAREIKTLESIPASADGTPGVEPWFFQDPSGRMPLLLSEYVVRTPRNFPLVHVVRNLGSNVEFEMTREDDADVYRWTANLSLPSREPDAVHLSERVPSVEIGIKATWEDVVFHELGTLEGRLIPSMRMRTLLTSILHPSPEARLDPEQAARAIYRYLCDNIDPTPTEGESAAYIQIERMGDRRLALLAMLRAAGLEAFPAAARPSEQFLQPPTWEVPSRDIFTVPMVRLVLPDGRTYWLDMRFDSLPFGHIADDLSGSTILSFLPSGPLFDVLPNQPAENSMVFREKMVRLPAETSDSLAISGRSLRRGVGGLTQGQTFAAADAEGRKKIILASIFPIIPDAVVSRNELVHSDGTDASSQIRYEATGNFPLARRADGIRSVSLCLLPAAVISAETRNLAVRRTACHIKTTHMVEDRNTFILPEGASFSRLPEPAHIPSRFGVYQLRVIRRGDNGVEIVRGYHIPAQRIPPWEWSDFLVFLDRADAAEKQWIEFAYN